MDCWPLTLAGAPLFVLEIRGETDHLNIYIIKFQIYIKISKSILLYNHLFGYISTFQIYISKFRNLFCCTIIYQHLLGNFYQTIICKLFVRASLNFVGALSNLIKLLSTQTCSQVSLAGLDLAKLHVCVLTSFVNFFFLLRFAAALLPRLFWTNPRSHHKGATGRVRTGDQQLPVLCHCQLGQDIPKFNKAEALTKLYHGLIEILL